jgi:hypothetical protein
MGRTLTHKKASVLLKHQGLLEQEIACCINPMVGVVEGGEEVRDGNSLTLSFWPAGLAGLAPQFAFWAEVGIITGACELTSPQSGFHNQRGRQRSESLA